MFKMLNFMKYPPPQTATIRSKIFQFYMMNCIAVMGMSHLPVSERLWETFHSDWGEAGWWGRPAKS